MKWNRKHNSSYYTSAFWNTIIYSALILILIIISIIIYIIFRSLLISVFKVEQAVGDMVSLIASMLFFILPLLPKIKNSYIKTATILQQKVYRWRRERTIPQDLKTTAKQASVIYKALSLLKVKNSHVIALEGAPGKGKTMTAVFLIDNIGNDENLLELFVQLQKHICYIDAGCEKAFLMNFLDDNVIAAKSLIIIDNVHKLSAEALGTVFDKITAVSEYADSTGSKSLIILLYQSVENNDSTSRLVHKYFNECALSSEQPFFNLNSRANCYVTEIDINSNIDTNGAILSKIRAEGCDSLRTQLINMYVPARQDTLLNFLMKILYEDNPDVETMEKENLKFIAIVVSASMYLGFITEEILVQVWKNCIPQCGIVRCHRIIKYFCKNRFMMPFPLMRKAYLFNEVLAHEYKKKLFSIPIFKEYFYDCANYIYKNNVFEADELKWLFLIACPSNDYQSVSESIRERQFYICVEALNKSYVLTALEEELMLDSQKRSLLQVELGILYIKTGLWTKAREVLKPYISHAETTPQIWNLQLQIIEADHGVDDEENLDMLNTIIDISNDLYIQFQARYWIAHIKMEQGNFSLSTWEDLKREITQNPQWNNESTYPHLVHRVTADTCRTFFLKGINEPDFFRQTLQFFERFRSVPVRQEDLALSELEEAHYIHYDLIYQLGIWRMYRFPHDKIKTNEDSATLNELIDIALKQYDESIIRFSKTGNKTWRTAQIRRDELSICGANPQFIEVLSHLDEFECYATDNRVGVFIGYAECLRGKTLALYALNNDIGNENSLYERRLEESLTALQKSAQVYEQYGNTFGYLRSNLLYILVNAVQMIAVAENPQRILENLSVQLHNLKNKFREENIREQQVLKYLTDLSSIKIGDIGNVIKYYPIVLQ